MAGRLRRALREHGLVTLGFRAAANLVAMLSAGRVRFVWYVIVAQPVRSDWRIPARMGRDIVVRWLGPDDALLEQAERPRSIIASRFAQGAICLASERSGELLGFLWLCPRRYIEDDVRCLFVLPPSGETWWDFDVWVRPDQRNGIVFAKLWQAAHAHLQEVGGRWTCSRITRNNSGSLAAHRRLGAVAVGNAVFVCARQWQVAWCGRPRLHFSRDPADMPHMTIRPPCKTADVQTLH